MGRRDGTRSIVERRTSNALLIDDISFDVARRARRREARGVDDRVFA